MYTKKQRVSLNIVSPPPSIPPPIAQISNYSLAEDSKFKDWRYLNKERYLESVQSGERKVLKEKLIKQVHGHPYTEHTYKRIVHVNDLPGTLARQRKLTVICDYDDSTTFFLHRNAGGIKCVNVFLLK